MDDHRRFPPPLRSEASFAWNQTISQANPWGNSQRTSSSFPHPVNSHLPLRGQSLYFKTRMCMRFRSGRCTDGDRCNFAHCIEELRKPSDNGAAQSSWLSREDYFNPSIRQNPNMPNDYVWPMNQNEEQKLNKNTVCRNFYNRGICSYGDKCSFLHVEAGSLQDNPADHNASSSRQNPLLRKTKLCHRWSTSGKCQSGDQCNHAHGDADLRKLGLNHCEADGQSVAIAAAAAAARPPSLTDDFFPKLKPQQDSPRITTLTLEKCKRIYGDWIDD